MGCSSASRTSASSALWSEPRASVRTWKTHNVGTVEDGPGSCDTLCRFLDEASRHDFPDDIVSSTDTATAMTQSLSMRSAISGMTSLHSMHSSKYHFSTKRGGLSDDLQSDVPAISESIADLDDLSELGNDRSFTAIDNRQHPLAPLSGTSHCDDRRSSCSRISMSPVYGDLGGCSDVPSIRDDCSVTSAPSEICLSFKTSRNSGTGSRCGSKDASSQRTGQSSRIGHMLSWRTKSSASMGEAQSGAEARPSVAGSPQACSGSARDPRSSKLSDMEGDGEQPGPLPSLRPPTEVLSSARQEVRAARFGPYKTHGEQEVLSTGEAAKRIPTIIECEALLYIVAW
eukprot:CAMPEP_0171098838 /NCGR_PEP_ID=MMETSP0766_2-20121228/49646_1 /TAXON_ID=439317 /ORGANISM="Gambierdiscus australes, Strain CAWD 149" /LENGTH=342 /DNA_ID=CAMNT_0011558299 /DNA_START=116 /DNA_END=1142 /DNA_ORIENTATION=-